MAVTSKPKFLHYVSTIGVFSPSQSHIDESVKPSVGRFVCILRMIMMMVMVIYMQARELVWILTVEMGGRIAGFGCHIARENKGECLQVLTHENVEVFEYTIFFFDGIDLV